VITMNKVVPGDPCSMLKRQLAGSSYKAEHFCVLCHVKGHSQEAKDESMNTSYLKVLKSSSLTAMMGPMRCSL